MGTKFGKIQRLAAAYADNRIDIFRHINRHSGNLFNINKLGILAMNNVYSLLFKSFIEFFAQKMFNSLTPKEGNMG